MHFRLAAYTSFKGEQFPGLQLSKSLRATKFSRTELLNVLTKDEAFKSNQAFVFILCICCLIYCLSYIHEWPIYGHIIFATAAPIHISKLAKYRLIT